MNLAATYPQQPLENSRLFAVGLIAVAVLAIAGGLSVAVFAPRTQYSTIYSVSTSTSTVPEPTTITSTTSTTSTVWSSTTSVSTTTTTTQNPYYYGNYPYQNYPYQNQYGNQISMTGIIYNQGNGCVYLQTNGNYYALQGNIPSNTYTNQQITVYGYLNGQSSQCGAQVFIVTS